MNRIKYYSPNGPSDVENNIKQKLSRAEMNRIKNGGSGR